MKKNTITKGQKERFAVHIGKQTQPRLEKINKEANKIANGFYKAMFTKKERDLLEKYGSESHLHNLDFSFKDEANSQFLYVQVKDKVPAIPIFHGYRSSLKMSTLLKLNKPKVTAILKKLEALCLEQHELEETAHKTQSDILAALDPIRTISALETNWPEIVEPFKKHSGWEESQHIYPITLVNTNELTEIIREATVEK